MEDVEWNDLAQDREKQEQLRNTVQKIRDLQNAEHFTQELKASQDEFISMEFLSQSVN